MKIESINPSNGQVIGSVVETTRGEVHDIFVASQNAFREWGRNLSLNERLMFLTKLYDAFNRKKDDISMLISREMGMPISYSRIDTDFALECFKWYLDNANDILADKVNYEDDIEIDKLIHEPKGVAAVIIAWNLPFSSYVWQVIPNLIVGNSVILKHSELVVLSSELISNITKEILPSNVFNVIFGDGKVGEYLTDEDVDIICFTGSSKIGKVLYEKAAKKFIPIVLECGGSAPGIVFEDADIDSVIESIYINRFVNNGQTCDGQKRLLVHESIKDELITKLKKLLSEKVVGDASDELSDFGPLVSLSQLDKLDSQVFDSVSNGAILECGGKCDINGGYYYNPAILSNVNENMRVFNEEVFGPVLPIITFKTREEALSLANNTEYGLGCYVYTRDKENYDYVVKNIESGMVALNNLYYLRPCNPFGGYKKSGFGKNNSKFAFEELCNIKIVTYEK